MRRTLALLLVFSGLFIRVGVADDFFEFVETRSRLPAPLSADSSHTLWIAQGLKIEDGVYCISEEEVSRIDAFTVVRLPNLPLAVQDPGAALLDGYLYVLSGVQLFVMDLSAPESGWKERALSPLASEGRPALVGINDTLYLVGVGIDGTKALAYRPSLDAWTSLSDAPYNLSGYIGTSCGNDHLLFFNANDLDNRIIAYHRITNTWFEMGQLPQALKPQFVGSSGSEFSLYTTDSVILARAVLRPTKYGWVDHSVVAVLVLLLIWVGVYFSKKEKSSGDYFRGGQRIPWWAAGLSLFATGASAISLMAMPGKSFAENWIYFTMALFIVVIQLPLLVGVYIPVARRLKISTANEYLERRFSLPVRMLGFVCFSLNQMLGRMAAILLLPALAISSIFGLPIEYSILIMGGVTTLFVTMGGLEAVIWTDVLQAVIMLIAVLVCAAFAFFALDVSIPVATDLLSNLDKLQMFDWRLDWQAPVVAVIFLNTFVSVLGTIGDQNFIQRVQCTQNEKESRKAIYTQLAVAIPMNFVLFSLGTLLFLFYVTRADTLSPALKADGVFPFFAAQNLPAGLAGFVVVALLAATISTVSSAMNSVANLGVEDFYRRFYPKVTDHQCLLFGRRLTMGLGIVGTVAALVLANTSGLQSIWDLFIMITGVVLAPITGIFVMGIFSRRVNNFGVWVGTAASVLANYYAKYHLDLHPMVYLIVGVFSCMVIGYFASYLAPPPPNEKVNGLTIFTLEKSRGE